MTEQNESMDHKKAQNQRVRNVTMMEGWTKDIFPWIEREMKAAERLSSGSIEKSTEFEMTRDHIAGTSVKNFIQRFLNRLNEMQGLPRASDEK